MDPSAERQNQNISGLPVQSFKEKTGAFNVTLSSTSHDKDPNLERQIQEIVNFVLRSEQSRKETRALDGPNTSISMGIDTNSAAECQIQESPGLPVQLFGQTRKEISAFDKPSTSSLADNGMDPTAERQSGELSGLPVQSFKKMAEETGALDKPSTSITTGFDTNPNAICQSQEKVDLDPQTCERSKKEKAHIGTVMTSIKKWSKLWNYFEELKRSLLKCTTCKKEIKVSHQTNRTKKMRAHLFNVHGISLDDDTLTLPDDLKHYYSELPGYKAKCKDCGKTVSFLTNVGTLRVHLRRRHSIKIQSQNKKVTASRRKRSKLWNYFEELKPTLVKCTTCQKEIKIPYPTKCTKIMRVHLNKHGISLDDDIYTLLPDDLREYYSVLPGYKAKCKNCVKTVSFLTNMSNLRIHLRIHSTRIQIRDITSSLADNGMDPSAERQSQDTSGLPVQSFKETAEETGKLNEPSTSSLADYSVDPTAERQSEELSGLPVQSFKETTEKTGTLDEPSTSSSMDYNTNSAAECQSQEIVDLDPQTCEQSRKGTRARDGKVTAPRRKCSKLWNYFEELKPSLVKCTTCKKEIKVFYPRNLTRIMREHLLNKHRISLDDDTLTLPDDLKQYYSELPEYKAKCKNCGKTLSFLTNTGYLRKHLRRHSIRILSQDEKGSRKKRSKLWNYFEELKPSLVKCTTCKKEIKVLHLKDRTKIMRVHLLKKHGISLDDDTVTLPDDLKQYYSELPGYKAKCKNCGKTLSFLTNTGYLRKHLRRHSIRILSQDEKGSRKKRSKLWNYFEELKPSLVKCTTCKKEIKVLHLKDRTKIMRVHLLKKHGISLDDDTVTLPDDLKQYYSELPGYKAKCKNCGKTLSF
ncbi:uncharacterized protein [Temnothorax longispinosus]|uniref:uncharacterized protein n=1 Tax=Temnothorax longispinosus TaxID=300112 RepID=UPI003A9A30F9